MLPLVALVGRPNVGKSTLFNALTRTRDALVHDQPGVTRDRNYGICRLDPEHPFVLVDTGGIAGDEQGLSGATARQARSAAAEADLVLFIVDAREGASALDDEILAWLRKTARPTLLVLNKIDGVDEDNARSDFARYGFTDVLTLSASHRQGLDELLEVIHERLPEEGAGATLDEDPARMRIAFVGRPNVGKSTLVNRLLGAERMIASEVPGTPAIRSPWTWNATASCTGWWTPLASAARARWRRQWRSSPSSRPCRPSNSARSRCCCWTPPKG